MSRSLHSDLNNPNLFEENQPGEYEYEETAYGKSVSGSLSAGKPSVRDGKAQLAAGGEDRRPDDDGGHIIGARFGAAPDSRNITAQNRNLNRSSYKRMENNWADHLAKEDKTFVHMETHDRGQRPEYYMGYVINEHPDGTRDWEAIGLNNESTQTQDEWGEALEDAYKQDPELANEMPNTDMGGLSPEEWDEVEDAASELAYSPKGGVSGSYMGSAATTSQSVHSNEGESKASEYLGTAAVSVESQNDSTGQGVNNSAIQSSGQSSNYLGTAAGEAESQESSIEQGVDQSADVSSDQSVDDSQDMG